MKVRLEAVLCLAKPTPHSLRASFGRIANSNLGGKDRKSQLLFRRSRKVYLKKTYPQKLPPKITPTPPAKAQFKVISPLQPLLPRATTTRMGLFSPPPQKTPHLLRALLATLLATLVLAFKWLGLSVAREIVVERRADKVMVSTSLSPMRVSTAKGLSISSNRVSSNRLLLSLLPPFSLYDPCLCYTE